MKNVIIIISFLIVSLTAKTQNNVFTENFELPSLGDSVFASGNPIWSISTTLAKSGIRSDSSRVAQSDSSILQTMVFSTLGSQKVYLDFSHICKIEFNDNAEIWVSNNNGISWVKLISSHYLGTSFFANQGNAFKDASYSIWQPGVPTGIPTNAWWKDERFDISAIAGNSPQVIVKFTLKDGNANGHNGNYGWLLDDIRVWTPPAQEAAIVAWGLPLSLPSGCGLLNETINLRFVNTGGNPISGNLSASFQRTGTVKVTESFSAAIIPGDTFTYTFLNKIDLTPVVNDTNYTVKVWIDLVSDPIKTNDTLTKVIASKVALPDPVISDKTIPYATSTVLTATHLDSIAWYSDILAINQLKKGSSFTTPVLYDTTIYYVQAAKTAGTGGFMITEICHYKFTTGAPVGGWPAYLIADDYIEITGVPNSNLSGHILEIWTGTALEGTQTLSSGTVLSPNGTCIIAMGQLGTSTPSPANFYYHSGFTATQSSTTSKGYILKKPTGEIIDAVIYGSISFPAASGVTSAHWTGTTPLVSSSGNRLAGAYTKNSANWINSGVSPQDPNILNSGVTLPAPPVTVCPSRVIAVNVNITGIPNHDAGIAEITQPNGKVNAGVSYPVKVRIKNSGIANLHKVEIKYSVNGALRPPYVWTGNLVKNAISQEITLGSEIFTFGVNNIKSWTTMPNDSVDWANHNDTATAKALVCLNGNYSIGGPNPDFLSFNEVKILLDSVGVCGPVVFNVESGIYNEQVVFGNISGVSATNTITFQSDDQDSTAVVLQFAATGTTNNYVVKLDGSSWMRFKNMTLKSTATAAFSRVFDISNGSHNNIIANNILESPIASASSVNTAVVFNNNTTTDTANALMNNVILKGSYGVYWYGVTAGLEKFSVISGNTIKDYYYYGLYAYNQDSIQIINNIITQPAATTINYGLYANVCSNNSRIQNNKVNIVGVASSCYGIYTLGSTPGLIINNNDVSVTNTSTNYAIWCSNNDVGFMVTNNKVYTNSSGTTYSIYLTVCDGSAASVNLVANNMVSHDGGTTNTAYGMYMLTNTFTDYYYNSVNVNGGSATAGRALSQSGGTNQNYVNNIFSNTKGGYAIYIATIAGVGNCDYNNLYTTGANLGFWTAAVTNLAAWKTASGKDVNSISVLPGFLSLTDLHVNNKLLDQKGTPIASVTTDIDGELRHSITPDIGADEFEVFDNDARVVELVSPLLPCPNSLQNIIVQIKNSGIDTLKNVTINWTINGITQTPYISSDTLLYLQTKNINIGSFTFSAGLNYNIKFWTSMPNGLPDNNPANDTIILLNFRAALQAGNYTIGGVGANYPNLTSAVNDLISSGICGPVVFNINPGIYNEQITIPQIKGASSINTITFKSSNNDSTSVLVSFAASGTANNFVVKLNGADHVKFNHLTIRATGATFGYGFQLLNSAAFNTISNCVIEAAQGTATTLAPIYSNSGTTMDSNNVIINNRIMNGYYGIYLNGSSSTVMEGGNIIEGNILKNFYYYGVYSYYQKSIIIKNNSFDNITTSATAYGVYTYYNDYPVVSGNSIIIKGTSTNYGIYSSYGDFVNYFGNTIQLNGTSTGYGIYAYYTNSGNSAINLNYIYNNAISQANSTGTIYGISNYYSNYTNYFYNSVHITAGSATVGYAFYSVGGANNTVINNIFSNIGGGYAYYISTIAAIVASNYNNLYATGTNLAYWTAARTNLAALQAVSGLDVNSLSINPNFYSSTNLHTNNLGLYKKGIPIAYVATDIDGDMRHATTPCIGADEFIVHPKDLGAFTMASPSSGLCYMGNEMVVLRIKNLGLDTLDFSIDSAKVYVSVTGPNPHTFAPVSVTSGIIPSGGVFDVFIDNQYDMSDPGSYVFSAYTTMVNDGSSLNNAMSPVTVINPLSISIFPFTENMETFTTGTPGVLTNGWTISPTSGYRWEVKSGSTLTANTGPGSDNTLGTSTGKYVFVEATNGVQGDYASFISPCTDLTTLSDPRLTFYYHAFGANIDSFFVDIYINGQWVNGVFKSFGQKHTSGSASWSKAIVDLNPYIGNIKFRFRAKKGAGELGDFAIDDITIKSTHPLDASVNMIYTLGKLALQASFPHSASALIENVGSLPLYNIQATLSVSGSNNLSVVTTIDTLLVAEVKRVYFPGYTSIYSGIDSVIVTLQNDQDNSNNKFGVRQIVTDSLFGFPNDAVIATNLGFGTGSGLFLNQHYINGTKMIKAVNVWITNSSTVGRTVYGVVVNKSGQVLGRSPDFIIGSSDVNKVNTFTIISPTAPITTNDTVYFGLAQVANPTAYYPLGVQQERPTRSGAYFSTGINGGSFTQYTQFGRFYIEGIVESPPAKDAGLITLFGPATGCGLTSNEILKIRLRNLSQDTIVGTDSTLTVHYQLMNTAAPVVSQFVWDTILPWQTKDVTFSVPLNMLVTGKDSTFYIKTWVKWIGDAIPNNDTLAYTVISRFIPPAPVVSPNQILTYGSQAVINAVASGKVYWYTVPTGGSHVDTGYTIITPNLFNDVVYYAEVKSTGGSSGNNIALNAVASHSGGGATTYGPQNYNDNIYNAVGNLPWGWVTTNGWIEYTWTTPQTFNKIKFFKDSRPMTTCTFQYWDGSAYVNFYNYNSSVTPDDSVVLANTVTTTKLRFNNVAGSSNPNFREIQVFDAIPPGCSSTRVPVSITITGYPNHDAGAAQIISPTGIVQSGMPLPVQVRIRNYGLDTLKKVQVNWSINGNIQPQFLWTGLVPYNSLSGVFNIGNGIFKGGNNTITVWTSLPNDSLDMYAMNDTVKSNVSGCFSGVYSVGNALADFPTIAAAYSALATAGICGHVTFNLVPGTYSNTQILIPATLALDATKTLTIQSSTGNPAHVIIEYNASGTSDNYVIKFDGAKYVTIRDITLKALNTTNGRVIDLTGGSSYIKIINNNIISSVSTSSTTAGIYSSSTIDNYNLIKNNRISNGYYGIYWWGSSTTNLEYGNVIDSNTIDNFYYYGIYAAYQDSSLIRSNNISTNSTSTTVYGLYSYYLKNKNEISKNRIHIASASTSYPLYLYYSDGTAASPMLVSNNMVSQAIGAGTIYGLYLNTSNFINIYFNSVNVSGSTTSGRAFYLTGGANVKLINNIFSNQGEGYACYIGTTTAVTNSDFNNFFTNGINLAYWNAANVVNLSALKATSGMDLNSISVNPQFFAIDNMHTLTYQLNAKATPIAGIIDDIDGDIRNLITPDIGADEFTPLQFDAGIISRITPVSPISVGFNPIKLVIGNFGTAMLTSASISWAVNSGQVYTYLWTGNIATGLTDTVDVGNYNFGAGSFSIKAWTSNPNSMVDGNNQNDTLNFTVIACAGPLSGTYTVGATGANFTTVSDAVSALKFCGISGPVVINVLPGIYTEQVVIPFIPGSSAINTVTMTSSTATANNVTIQFNASLSNANFVIQFNSAQHFILKNITLKSVNSTLGRVVDITNSSSNITIENNIIYAPVSTVSTSAGIYSYNTKEDNIKIKNNEIYNGYYGIYLYGVGTSSLESGNIIEGNTIDGFYYYGIYSYYQDAIKIIGNILTNSLASTSICYGLSLNYNDNFIEVVKNKIHLKTTGSSYGAYIYYCDGTTANRGLIANNFVSCEGNTGTSYGIYPYYSTYQDFVYNSVNMASGSTSAGRAMYLYYGSNNRLYNNIFANTAGGFAIYYTPAANPIINSDNNDFYTNGVVLSYAGTANATDLNAWRLATLLDSNSVSVDPGYFSVINLHVTNPQLDGSAKVFAGITDDIDGDLRHLTTPDIGADEFSAVGKDIGVFAFNQPVIKIGAVGTNVTIEVQVRNFGLDTITSFTVHYKVGAAAAVTTSWTGNLFPGTTTNVSFPTPYQVLPGNQNIASYTTLTGDVNLLNDTSKIVYRGIPIVALTFTDNFEGADNFYTMNSPPLWEKGTPNASIINSAYSPVTSWATNLTGNYTNNAQEYLYTPYFNFSSVTGATMKFWHWYHTETAQDACRIQYTKDGGANWSQLGYVGDPYGGTTWYTNNLAGTHGWSGSSSGWVQAIYDLTDFNNTTTPVQFRFHFFSNASNNSFNGWAIDNFSIALPPVALDASVKSIDQPVSSTVNGSTVTVNVTIKNSGSTTLTSIPVGYRINNNPVVNETWTGSLLMDSVASYTFTTPYTSPNTSYKLCVFTKLPSDQYPLNDTVCTNLSVTPAPFDAGITALLEPASQTIFQSQVSVKVRIKNFGTSTLTSIPMEYTFGTSGTGSGTWTGSLLANATVDYSFPATYSGPLGVYNLCVRTKLVTDADSTNDKICTSLTGIVGLDELARNGFAVMQNRPNPAKSNTEVDVILNDNGELRFTLVDVLGNEIYRKTSTMSTGTHTLTINLENVAPGIYYYYVDFNNHRVVKKMTVL